MRQSRNQTKRWVNQEGHEAHEGYDLGEFETPPLKNNLSVLQLRALRVFVVRSNSFYKITSVRWSSRKFARAAKTFNDSSYDSSTEVTNKRDGWSRPISDILTEKNAKHAKISNARFPPYECALCGENPLSCHSTCARSTGMTSRVNRAREASHASR